MRYRFAFPQKNGDMPTVKAVDADSVADAIKKALSDLESYSDIDGSTIFRGDNWERVGEFVTMAPGPKLYVNKVLIWTCPQYGGRGVATWADVFKRSKLENANP